ncbi:DUF1415 domain-containing protein [Halomonas denitrificans]|nr:DUF1415 domain-containing protein [Halomonas denitrificans]
MPASFQPGPADGDVERATRRWLERAVLGLDLCPFARGPYEDGRVRIVVSAAKDANELAGDLEQEMKRLADTDSSRLETTLLVHPGALVDFLEYNDFLDVADALLDALDLAGTLQVASFHPYYRFADVAADDPANCTNRSPYPTLHLLRESSIERAVNAYGDTDAIYERNIETLRRIGEAGWRARIEGEE